MMMMMMDDDYDLIDGCGCCGCVLQWFTLMYNEFLLDMHGRSGRSARSPTTGMSRTCVIYPSLLGMIVV